MISVEQERDKYRRMWAFPGYRHKSPGEELVKMFLRKAQPKPGDTLVDAGCGPGRASLLLAEAGLNVTMLDITSAAPDKKARHLPFMEACLWERNPIIFDWVYCCDVLEHIPPEHVDATLDNLAAMGRKGAFLQIAMFAESFGRRIGETLHLTIMPTEWWMKKIYKRWSVKGKHQAADDRLIVLTDSPIDQ